MSNSAMEAAGRPSVTVLAGDPESGWVYWECPALKDSDQKGQVALAIRGMDDRWRVVEKWEIDQALGGRFFEFHVPDMPHRCLLTWGDEQVESQVVQAPRREPGDAQPRFVRVRLTEQGLETEPVAHEHPTQGLFAAAHGASPSSHTLGRSD